MNPRGWRDFLYNLLRKAQWGSLTAQGAIAASLKAEPANWPTLQRPLEFLQHVAWWAIPLMALGTFLSDRACKMLGPPWVWESIHAVLDHFQEQAFRGAGSPALHDNRVTLFKRVWWHWPSLMKRRRPWGGWLKPVARSGHTTQQSATVFMAPDDAKRAEGVAGKAWSCAKALELKELPNVYPGVSGRVIDDYARRTFVSREWVEQRIHEGKPLPQYLCGIPVDMKGRRWGVIVLDSQAPRASHPQITKTLSRPIAVFLDILLRRA